MPKISPRVRRALTEERRKQILDAATQVFATKGFDRATIADVARAAGVAEGSIYNYFKSKGDLLVSIPRQAIQTPVEIASEQIRALATAPIPPPQTLAALARSIIATVRENAHIFRILISALPTMSVATRQKYLDQVVMYAVTALEGYFAAQIERGIFRADLDAHVLARAFIGMFFPFVMLAQVLQVESTAAWDDDQLVANIVPLFLNGVLAPQGEAQSAQPRQTARTSIAIE